MTEQAVLDAVTRYADCGDGHSFGFEFGGNVWAEVGAVARDLNTGWGRVNGICRDLVKSGQLVAAPGGGPYYKPAG